MDDQLKQFVWSRAGNRCEYCQISAELTLLPFQIDHIISRKLGGETTVQNLALSCERCNSHKGPLAAGLWKGELVRLFNPRDDQWNKHFQWKGPVMIGLTEIGKVTIEVLSINLAYRVELRQTLMTEGVFPPDSKPN